LSILDSIINEDENTARAKIMQGVVIGIVTDNNDPEKLGRVKINYPWMSPDNVTDWTRIATFMSGAERGSYFVPEIDDEVLVAFEHGDINRPFVIGSLWSKEDKPPDTNQEEKNNIKKFTSRAGHELIFDDTDSSEKFEIHTKSGHQILLDDKAGSEKITIKDKTGDNYIEIDSVNNSIQIESKLDLIIKATNITIDASANLTIKSGASTKIEAGAGMSIKSNAPMSVKSDTTMSVESGAIMELKGAIININ